MRRLTAAAWLLLGLAGCVDRLEPAAPAVDPALWVDAPSCVLVLPADAEPALGLLSLQLEEALARHLTGRIDRVLGPGRREALARRAALDPGRAGDRARLATVTGCAHAALLRVRGGRAWGLVWSEVQIGVAVAVLRLADDRMLWQGRAAARRGDGGLPLSPLSAALAAGLAARHAADGEVAASVLDDALRAALRGLPDFRGAQPFVSRNSSVSPLSSRK